MVEPFGERGALAEDSVEARLREATGTWREVLEPDEAAHTRALRDATEARVVIPEGSAAEAGLLAQSAATVENYFDAELERPWNFDPVGRELHLEADIGGLVLHGFIDRLDRYETSSGEERWVISDYKTGKVPQPRYLDEAFFAMKVYALLLAEAQGVTPFSLRLLYVSASKDSADKRVAVTPALLEGTRSKMTALWRAIEDSATYDVWEERTGPLCGWCHFKTWCPAFGGYPAAAPKSWLEALSAEGG
jgi:putative RecB family exonuclease